MPMEGDDRGYGRRRPWLWMETAVAMEVDDRGYGLRWLWLSTETTVAMDGKYSVDL